MNIKEFQGGLGVGIIPVISHGGKFRNRTKTIAFRNVTINLFDNVYPLQLWHKRSIFSTQKVLLQIVVLITLLNTLTIFSELQGKYPKVPAPVREIWSRSGWDLLQ